jgi:predicted nucleotidyltransferase component of viral defense system
MKDYLRELLARETPDLNRRRNVVREYLQARMLQLLGDQGAYREWAFLGGTALRFLYGLQRFSEDLDFSLNRQDTSHTIVPFIEGVCAAFVAETYSVDRKIREDNTVKSAVVKFRGLFYELGLSMQPDEVFMIKVEVDTRPPEGAGMAISIVRRHVEARLLHYDPASLLAGKLHAVLSRPYTKGRDLYDLMWYLSDRRWPAPNLILLNNALDQTGWKGSPLTEETWRNVVATRLEQMDFERAVIDVRPFLERPQDAALLTRDNLLDLVGKNSHAGSL